MDINESNKMISTYMELDEAIDLYPYDTRFGLHFISQWDSNWSELMKVVERITNDIVDEYSFYFQISKNNCQINFYKEDYKEDYETIYSSYDNDNLLDSIYNCVLEWIKWRNKERIS